MTDDDWEGISDAFREMKVRLIAAEKNVAAITKSYQDVSGSLEECKRRIKLLEDRLTADETDAAWYSVEGEPQAAIRTALDAFRVDYGTVLHMWRLQMLEEVRREMSRPVER